MIYLQQHMKYRWWKRRNHNSQVFSLCRVEWFQICSIQLLAGGSVNEKSHVLVAFLGGYLHLFEGVTIGPLQNNVDSKFIIINGLNVQANFKYLILTIGIASVFAPRDLQ